jgi:adenosylcobinamide-GDP ribazoletransferase
VKGLLIAIQFLTRLPTPRLTVSSEEFAASMRWFPAVGLIVGAIVAGGGWLGTLVDPWTGAIVALFLWVAITGALHLDGLGDVADACGAAHKDRERMLAVLADPHIGSFGVVAIALQIAAKLVLLHGAIEAHSFLAIGLVPFAARIGPLIWSRWLPDLHAGLGARFRRAVGPVTLLFWAVALATAAWWSWGLVSAPVLIIGWGVWLKRALGGISGDGHGAGIEIVESGLLLAALIVARLL